MVESPHDSFDMSRVIVAGDDGALTESLAAQLGQSAVAGDCETAGLAALQRSTPDHRVIVLIPGEVRGFPDVETAARAAASLFGAAHLVLISSAAVVEPNAHHPGLVTEERLPGQRLGNALARRWRELEERVRGALDGAATILTVLRPAILVIPGSRAAWSRFFTGRVACCVAGFDPTIQLLSAADLAAAVARAIAAGERAAGVFNVAPAGGVPLRKALAAAGVRRLPLPYWKLRLWYKLLGRPVGMLDYLRYSWTVSGEKIRRRLDVRTTPAGKGHDDFGLDPDYIRRLGKVFFRFLHDAWWRVEWRGLEHVPRRGRVVLTGFHRGHQPWDGVMAMYYLTREIGRTPRFLVHPGLIKFPYLAPYMLKLGGVPACRENAAWVLERDEILGIFPEGIHGAFHMYDEEIYELGSFGRHDFVKLALSHRAPIVPFVTVGSAETFPILARLEWSWWKRATEWPFLPITPTMGIVPLPSKWHSRILAPIHVAKRYPPEAAEDPAVVRELSREVRGRMAEAIGDMLSRRKSIFYGSVFRDFDVARDSDGGSEGKPGADDVRVGVGQKTSKP